MIRIPAEWERQEAVQLNWPHVNTDWRDMLEEVTSCFVNIARAVTSYEHLLVVTPIVKNVEERLRGEGIDMNMVTLFECPTDDTWARDNAFITGIDGGRFVLNDFRFNGWGDKFCATLDDQVNRRMSKAGLFPEASYRDLSSLVLEGGSVEFDGCGTMLTTASCLLSENRNGFKSPFEAYHAFSELLGVTHFLCLQHGSIVGDDTDGHIDTLARLCPSDVIVYVKCYNQSDINFSELSAMESELQSIKTIHGSLYRLVPLPLPAPVFYNGERLPATYANFLIVNGAVLVPQYGQSHYDAEVLTILKGVFPDRDVIGIDCLTLIRQHGSLHCVTMQYPKGVGINHNI